MHGAAAVGFGIEECIELGCAGQEGNARHFRQDEDVPPVLLRGCILINQSTSVYLKSVDLLTHFPEAPPRELYRVDSTCIARHVSIFEKVYTVGR